VGDATKVQRYEPDLTSLGEWRGMKRDPDGQWVLATDYDALAAQRDALVAAMEAATVLLQDLDRVAFDDEDVRCGIHLDVCSECDGAHPDDAWGCPQPGRVGHAQDCTRFAAVRKWQEALAAARPQ
jgi:hypothetical protein